ncbi:MAG TPA: HlyD family efflux transporter periplasmic adaptor subunit, partial [Desulfurella acetivorans]|nr:HlyD family efflux transporter periplasmic adaptor subunit [Desulfurella acetivorans]
PGQYVQPGQTLLMVVPLKAAWVNANFKENQIHRIKIGDKATVTIDAYPGVEFKGYYRKCSFVIHCRTAVCLHQMMQLGL